MLPERKTMVSLRSGERVSAREVEFEIIREEWNEYRLEDGTSVRVKNVAVKIFRVLDDESNPGFTDEGEPYVIVRSRNMLSAR